MLNDNGLVVCRHGGSCSCGLHRVKTGVIYKCDGIYDPGIIVRLFHNCDVPNCDGLIATVVDIDHCFCWRRFSPLGDPDEQIEETDEPCNLKQVEDDSHDVPIQTPVKEPENV